MTCVICDNPFSFRWTDTHGVSACIQCGNPYRLYHYDENKKRVDKPPQNMTKVEWIPIIRRYWEEHHRNTAPGFGNFPGSSYEVAAKGDFEVFDAWMKKQTDLPSSVEESLENGGTADG